MPEKFETQVEIAMRQNELPVARKDVEMQKKKKVDAFERKIQEMYEKRKETDPDISVNFFYGPHESATDVETFKERFQQCDIFIPEQVGWDAKSLELMRTVSRGGIMQEQFNNLKAVNKEFNAAVLDLLYNSKKPIVFIDVPKEHKLSKELAHLYQDFKIKFPRTSFDEMVAFMENFLRKDDVINRQREDYMLTRMKSAIQTTIKEFPTLQGRTKINILLTLGELHTRLYHILDKTGLQTQREFKEMPITFGIGAEIVRRYRFKKEVDRNLLVKATFEYLIGGEVERRISQVTSNLEKLHLFMRKLIEKFNEDEMRELGNRSNESGSTDLFIQKAREKNISFPQTEQELDEMIGWKEEKK
ncbi:MAG: hypothetical protein HY001_03520 [Candidatus Portnoybacteria bacterium]|nr:hypothetical protein [Candidatus Portnoybacteria bacterium]